MKSNCPLCWCLNIFSPNTSVSDMFMNEIISFIYIFLFNEMYVTQHTQICKIFNTVSVSHWFLTNLAKLRKMDSISCFLNKMTSVGTENLLFLWPEKHLNSKLYYQHKWHVTQSNFSKQKNIKWYTVSIEVESTNSP